MAIAAAKRTFVSIFHDRAQISSTSQEVLATVLLFDEDLRRVNGKGDLLVLHAPSEVPHFERPGILQLVQRTMFVSLWCEFHVRGRIVWRAEGVVSRVLHERRFGGSPHVKLFLKQVIV